MKDSNTSGLLSYAQPDTPPNYCCGSSNKSTLMQLCIISCALFAKHHHRYTQAKHPPCALRVSLLRIAPPAQLDNYVPYGQM
jgi:hypothetical protein